MHEIIQTSIMITAFVMLMMLFIEYINVQTRGAWGLPLKRKPWVQILLAAILGSVPGCLGVYTVVSLFTHKIMGFGAMVASMIATSGDEAFMMFALMPEKALWLTIIIFLVAILAGFISHSIYKSVNFTKHNDHDFHIHQTESKCKCLSWSTLKNNFKPLSFTRGLILTALVLFMVQLIIGSDHHQHTFAVNQEVFSQPAVGANVLVEEHHHDIEDEHADTVLDEEIIHEEHSETEHHVNVPKIIFLIFSLIAFFIVITSPNHFIEEHAWNHVIKKHFLRILLWSFGTLLLIFLVKNYMPFNLESMIENNLHWVLIIALLIGIIPESGPHMVFISLFLSGLIPFSILMANSIVQDGHGALPLLAENKKAFLHMKLVNILVGALMGGLGIAFGF
ncbi:MAG: arsenic efflux protein [Bacteroidales bacterium]|nr:arsenic efflux protein [Bacteroidales bacterium]